MENYSKECEQIHHAWLKLQELESATGKVSNFTGLQVRKSPMWSQPITSCVGSNITAVFWCLLLSKHKSRWKRRINLMCVWALVCLAMWTTCWFLQQRTGGKYSIYVLFCSLYLHTSTYVHTHTLVYNLMYHLSLWFGPICMAIRPFDFV